MGGEGGGEETEGGEGGFGVEVGAGWRGEGVDGGCADEDTREGMGGVGKTCEREVDLEGFVLSCVQYLITKVSPKKPCMNAQASEV